MTERYTFNQSKKRLEPNSTLCQFCFQNISTDPAQTHYASVYNEKDRTNIIVYRSVQFKKVSIGIPRCIKCQDIHRNSKIVAWILGLIIGIITIGLLQRYLDSIALLYFLSAFAITIVPYFVSQILTTIFVVRTGIFTTREGAEKEPVVQNLLQNGWTLDTPVA